MRNGIEKVGIAGVGALGGIVAQELTKGIDGYRLHGVSDLGSPGFDVPNLDFAALAEQCDVIIECLPAAVVPDLVNHVMSHGKILILISSCALVLYPELLRQEFKTSGRIIVPSGALAGLDAVAAMAVDDIRAASIVSTKPPKGFAGAPFLLNQGFDVLAINEKTRIFAGNVFEAAKAFPANVNVAATLALAGIGPERTQVEVWADPEIKGNRHEIIVEGRSATIRSSIENMPDPSNPKSSRQAAYSIIAALRKRKAVVTYF